MSYTWQVNFQTVDMWLQKQRLKWCEWWLQRDHEPRNRKNTIKNQKQIFFLSLLIMIITYLHRCNMTLSCGVLDIIRKINSATRNLECYIWETSHLIRYDKPVLRNRDWLNFRRQFLDYVPRNSDLLPGL